LKVSFMNSHLRQVIIETAWWKLACYAHKTTPATAVLAFAGLHCGRG
jgi:hypothetical protein